MNIEKDNTNRVRVTVFTPTFNRKHTLERLYRSLQSQTYRDFEWLIVDDGSTDGTETLVSEWQKKENFFPIRYYWKPNGGKHTAHNFALTKANGYFLAIQDSDDWYTNDGLMNLISAWESIPREQWESYANVEGLCSLQDGTLLGRLWPTSPYDCYATTVRKWRRDTMGMYRLEILKSYPFPEGYEGGLLVEGIVWNRIGRKYLTRFINSVVGIKEYLPGGLSDRPIEKAFKNSKGAILFYSELALLKTEPLLRRLLYRTNIYRYALHNHESIVRLIKNEKHPIVDVALLPLSITIYAIDFLRVQWVRHFG